MRLDLGLGHKDLWIGGWDLWNMHLLELWGYHNWA